jgi:hypothetical protein
MLAFTLCPLFKADFKDYVSLVLVPHYLSTAPPLFLLRRYQAIGPMLHAAADDRGAVPWATTRSVGPFH